MKRFLLSMTMFMALVVAFSATPSLYAADSDSDTALSEAEVRDKLKRTKKRLKRLEQEVNRRTGGQGVLGLPIGITGLTKAAVCAGTLFVLWRLGGYLLCAETPVGRCPDFMEALMSGAQRRY